MDKAKWMHRFALIAALASVVAAISEARAAVWTFDRGDCGPDVAVSGTVAVDSCSANGLTIKGLSDTGSGGKLEFGYLGVYGTYDVELGVINKEWNSDSWGDDSDDERSPEHAMDNETRRDAMLLAFSGPADLARVYFGWTYNDSDISVLAYTGAAPFNSATHLTNLSYSQLTANGWSLIGHYANAGSQEDINAGNVAATHWLIGTYIPALGAGSGINAYNHDYVKLSGVKGEINEVSEPGTLALLGLGALLVGGLQRHRWRWSRAPRD